jgi:hypothetical protein
MPMSALGLVAELDGPVDAALADRPRVGSCRLTSRPAPSRAVRHLSGQPVPGVPHQVVSVTAPLGMEAG